MTAMKRGTCRVLTALALLSGGACVSSKEQPEQPPPGKRPAAAATSTELRSQDSFPASWSVASVQSQKCSAEDSAKKAKGYSETVSKFYTWMTGTLEQAHYEPLGEVANYFGFAALRTEIRERAGKHADENFRGRVYEEVLELLNAEQRAILYELLAEHRKSVGGFLSDRVALVDALWVLKRGESLDFDRIEELMRSVGRHEGNITVATTRAYGKLLPTLSAQQRQHLDDIRSGKITAADMAATALPFAKQSLEQFGALSEDDQSLIKEIASKFIAWSTGELKDALLLPPGKIGNYFGFSSYRYVDRTTASRSGAASRVDEVLNADQQAILCGAIQSIERYTKDYVEGRAKLITTLYGLKKDPGLDVAGLAADYAKTAAVGEGRRAAIEALTFHVVETSMTDEQRAKLRDSRASEKTAKPKRDKLPK